MAEKTGTIRNHTAADVLDFVRAGLALDPAGGDNARRRTEWTNRIREFLRLEKETLDEGVYGTISEALEDPIVRRRIAQIRERRQAEEQEMDYCPSEWTEPDPVDEVIRAIPSVFRTHRFDRRAAEPAGLNKFMSRAVAAFTDGGASNPIEIATVCRHADLSPDDGWAALAVLLQDGLAELQWRDRFRPKVELIRARLDDGGDSRGRGNTYIAQNVAAMGPGATANRTSFQNTAGAPALVQFGGNELGSELLHLVTTLATKDPLACAHAADALGAQKRGDGNGLLSSLGKIGEGVLTEVAAPLLVEYLKAHTR